jgi:hypothetical protein
MSEYGVRTQSTPFASISARDHMKAPIRQFALQAACFGPGGRKPVIDVRGLGEDHRHGLGMHGGNFGVRLGGEEAEQVAGDFAFRQLAGAGPAGPDAGKEAKMVR